MISDDVLEEMERRNWSDILGVRMRSVKVIRELLGDKKLVGNKGFRRYLKSTPRFEVDEQKIADEERFDGNWVLTTNTGLTPKVTALVYKQLWMVESLFRSMKSVFDVHDLGGLQQTTLSMNGKGYVVRSDAEGTVGKVFQACRVALPPRVRPLQSESPAAGTARVTTADSRP